ncbi:MAG: carbohydrate kinase family protein, partial [Chloroflexota bacterium]|nr:carbohydrate kinase family protein [Chloroflexota bacterium]
MVTDAGTALTDKRRAWRMRRVTVIGDALLDVLVRPSSAPSVGTDSPAQISVGPGGQGANVAVGLARRGLPVRLVAATGTDAGGRLLRDLLSAEGVDLV